MNEVTLAEFSLTAIINASTYGSMDAGRSVLMIEHMEKIGEIEHTEHYHLYRRR
jgi:hypothetical protein